MPLYFYLAMGQSDIEIVNITSEYSITHFAVECFINKISVLTCDWRIAWCTVIAHNGVHKLPEKWLHNWIIYPSNWFKQIWETHMADALVHNIRGKHGFKLRHFLSVKLVVFFIQTFWHRLCTGAISGVSFSDLFGPIAGATNSIM